MGKLAVYGKREMTLGSLYALVHFSVEVACFYYLFAWVSSDLNWWAFALLFDALAFIPQGIIGSLSDKHPQLPVGVIGCVLMLVAFLQPFKLVGLPFLALGNAMIHISGAQFTLRGAEGKIGPNALFVGGGSFGVVTGQLLGKSPQAQGFWIPLALLLLSLGVLSMIQKKMKSEQADSGFDIAAPRSLGLIVLLAFIGVTVRGYIAYAIPTEWNKTVPQTIALFVCMGIGKCLGGFLADRLGYRWVTILSLVGGLPFLLFGNERMYISLIGVALFSMTMPVTVGILASVFPKESGLAFGITTIGLFLGVAPSFFLRPESLLAHQLTVLILTLIVLPSTLFCLRRCKK